MKSPFFIVGIGRSGTTLLRLMFHNHPNIAIPYESHFITEYYDNLENYGDLSKDESLQHLLTDIFNENLLKQWDHNFNQENIIKRIKNRKIGDVFRAIYDDYTEAKGKKRWGDKSDYLDRMHVINEMFPDAKFIHIIRDGRDVANSVLKLPWGPKDIIQAAEWWHSHVILGKRMGSMLDKSRYTEIRYEDLVTNTEKELKTLCEFIGEKFSPEMMNYHQNSSKSIPESRKGQHYNADSPPKTDRVAAWKREMTTTDIAIFNSYSSRSLLECGYEVKQQNVSGFWVTINKFIILLKRILK